MVVDALRCSGVVCTVLSAGGGMSWLDIKSIEVGGEGRINRGTPLPIDRHSGDASSVEGAVPAHSCTASRAGRWDRDTGKKDLIVCPHRNGSDPRIGHRTEGRRSTRCGRREGDLSVGDRICEGQTGLCVHYFGTGEGNDTARFGDAGYA